MVAGALAAAGLGLPADVSQRAGSPTAAARSENVIVVMTDDRARRLEKSAPIVDAQRTDRGRGVTFTRYTCRTGLLPVGTSLTSRTRTTTGSSASTWTVAGGSGSAALRQK